MSIAVTAYRFGSEDGTEATHGWLADLNTAVSRDRTNASTFFVRYLVQATGTGQSNCDFTLRRSLDGGAFASVSTSSTGVKAVTTAIFADATATTSRLGGSGTFELTSQGTSHDGIAGGPNFDIVADGRGECLYSVQLVPGDLAAVSTITFELLVDGVAFTQSVTPTINLADAGVTALPVTGTLSLSGQAPTVSAEAAVTTALAAVAVTGVAPSFSALVAAAPTAGIVALAGLAPSVDVGGALTERLSPNAVVAGGTNLRDTDLVNPPVRVADLADDTSGSPGPDALWWTALNEEGDIDVRLAFPTSSGNLVGMQTINVLVRGTSLPSRDVKLQLYEGGIPLTPETTESITSIDGQIVSLVFDASDLADITGASVELRISAIAA